MLHVLVLPGILVSPRVARFYVLARCFGQQARGVSGDIRTSRPTRKQKAGKAKAKADTAAKVRGEDVGKSPPMPA